MPGVSVSVRITQAGIDLNTVSNHEVNSVHGHCAHTRLDVCLLLFYSLATSKVISGPIPTYDCDSVNSWRLYSAAPFGNLATSTNFKVIGLTRPGLEPKRFGFPDLPKWEMDALLIRPSCLVTQMWITRGPKT